MKIVIDINEVNFNIHVAYDEGHKESMVNCIDYIIEYLEPSINAIHEYLFPDKQDIKEFKNGK